MTRYLNIRASSRAEKAIKGIDVIANATKISLKTPRIRVPCDETLVLGGR